MDENGRGVVTFHSDKLSTADIQANSTPNKESENAKEIIDSSDLSDDDKKKSKSTIENGQKKLAEKESEVIFKVIDNGIGVPKDQQSKLFTKMFFLVNLKLIVFIPKLFCFILHECSIEF